MKFKIFTGSLLLVGASLMVTSCHDDLDVRQPSYYTGNIMWQSENDFETAINGAYSQFRGNFAELLCTYGDLRASYLESGGVNNAYYNRVPTNEILIADAGTNWSVLYTNINNVNLVLKHINDINFSSETKRNTILANAYFLRAYLYYTIARVWGDAPVLTVGFESERQEGMYPSRQPAAEVFAQVESDIDQAALIVPAGKSIHKASAGAINMLRADYYSWKYTRLNGTKADLEKAQTSINAVLGAGYTFASDFSKLIGTSNENNDEFILTMPFTLNENVTATSGASPYFYAYFPASTDDGKVIAAAGYGEDVCMSGSWAQYVAPQQWFVDFMKAEPKDVRTNLTVRAFDQPEITGRKVYRMIVKFPGTLKDGIRIFDTDMPIYRLGEAYLLKAEIENKLGNTTPALEALNKIAKRAYGVDNYYTTTDKNAITEAICNETMKELALEGKAWWTYIRNNKAFEMIPSLKGREADYGGNILLWPVALASINTNPNITQTDGFTK